MKQMFIWILQTVCSESQFCISPTSKSQFPIMSTTIVNSPSYSPGATLDQCLRLYDSRTHGILFPSRTKCLRYYCQQTREIFRMDGRYSLSRASYRGYYNIWRTGVGNGSDGRDSYIHGRYRTSTIIHPIFHLTCNYIPSSHACPRERWHSGQKW